MIKLRRSIRRSKLFPKAFNFLVCPYCDKIYEAKNGLLSCPAGRGNYHVLVPEFSADDQPLPPLTRVSAENNPFRLFCKLISSFYLLRRVGKKTEYQNLLAGIDGGLLNLEEPCISCTHLLSGKKIAENGGFEKIPLFIKLDAGNATGSHKVRHAIGNLFYLEAVRILAGETNKKDLAIYSCGNAALATAATAETLGYKLYAFVPENIPADMLSRLLFYGARVVRVTREKAGGGDPCYNRFEEAVGKLGLTPCSCSGPDNWPNIEGGATLFYEMALQMRNHFNCDLDTVIIQAGGGALASSVIYAASVLQSIGFFAQIPKFFCVQTQSCHPLSVSFEKVKKYQEENKRMTIDALIKNIGREGGKFMSPWSANVPESLAEGILDDTTYDFLAVTKGLLESGGGVVVVSENEIETAYNLAKSSGFRVSPTGTAGLAGFLKLLKENRIEKGEKVGLLFTGIDKREERPADRKLIEERSIVLENRDKIEKILTLE